MFCIEVDQRHKDHYFLILFSTIQYNTYRKAKEVVKFLASKWWLLDSHELSQTYEYNSASKESINFCFRNTIRTLATYTIIANLSDILL